MSHLSDFAAYYRALALNGLIQKKGGERWNLPFNLDPPLRSYLDSGYPMGIVTSGGALQGSMLHHQLQMLFPARKLLPESRDARVLIFPALRMKEFAALGYIEITKCAFGRDLSQLVEHLIAGLRRQRYLLMNVDEFFIPGTAFFHKVNYRHAYLLVGCDLRAKCFSGVSYLSDGSFGITNVPFKVLVQSIARARELIGGETLYIQEVERKLSGWGEFNPALACLQIQDYLVGNNNIEKYCRGIFSPPGCEVIGGSSEDYHGTAVYPAFKLYFSHLVARREKIDLRATRTLAEHKGMITACLQAMWKVGSIASDMPRKFARISSLAKTLHLTAFAYNVDLDCAAARRLAGMVDRLADEEHHLLSGLVLS